MFQRRLQEAIQVAALAASFSAHQESCIKDKAEIKAQLATQDAERLRMHAENQAKFTELATANKWIQRSVWIASGAVLALKFVAENGLHELAKAVGVHG